MHNIEPYYHWRDYYIASEDERSPFYDTYYDEFRYSQKIYNYFIHPQWDNIDSTTLFLKVLFVDYFNGTAIIELIGEWNDCLHNDIMLLKRNLADDLLFEGINKFVLIGENVLNFHASDDCYYEEWSEEINDGWVVMLNFQKHVIDEMQRANIGSYFHMDERFSNVIWQQYNPVNLCEFIKESLDQKRHKELVINS